MSTPESIHLIVRRTIRATPDRLFEAWTDPKQLEKWWGPPTITCSAAEVDLRVGGRYRLANQHADGSVLWIVGEFELVDPPNELRYTWALGADAPRRERVTVRFVSQGEMTEVVVVHERIESEAARIGHEQGWLGCLEGLEALIRE